MPKHVVFVRHGESESNVIIHENQGNSVLSKDKKARIDSFSDPNITKIGERQGQTTGKYLVEKIKKMDIQKINIMVSPFKRAKQTLEPFLTECKTESMDYTLEVLNELQEFTSVKKKLSEDNKKDGLSNHEKFEHFVDDVLKFNKILKNKLKQQSDHEILVIYGHSIFFSVLFSYHISQEEIITYEKPNIRQPNCSITCQSYDTNTNKWITYFVSSISHLPEDLCTGTEVPFGT